MNHEKDVINESDRILFQGMSEFQARLAKLALTTTRDFLLHNSKVFQSLFFGQPEVQWLEALVSAPVIQFTYKDRHGGVDAVVRVSLERERATHNEETWTVKEVNLTLFLFKGDKPAASPEVNGDATRNSALLMAPPHPDTRTLNRLANSTTLSKSLLIQSLGRASRLSTQIRVAQPKPNAHEDFSPAIRRRAHQEAIAVTD